MRFHNSLVALVSLVGIESLGTDAYVAPYVNVSSSALTSSITTDNTGPTPIPLQHFEHSVPLNNTVQNGTLNQPSVSSSSEIPIPTLSDLPSNQTSTNLPISITTTSHAYNATTTNLVYNTTSTFPHAFNTSAPTKPYANATATYSKWFTQANRTSQASGPTPPPVNLAPAIPPSVDPHDPIVLTPNKTVNLYFQGQRQSNSTDIPMASVDIPKMAYPAVVLDHSALIADMECDLRKLRLKFLHRSALDAAEGAWTMPKFVMMAFHEKCGRASRTGERDYLLVHGLKFDRKKLSVSADIKHIGIIEAVGKENPITVDMGTYTPNSLNGTTGFNTQAPTTARNGTQTNVTAPSDFDVALDDKIGYTTLSTTSLVVKRHTGLDPSVHLHIRGWFSKIVKAIKKVVKKVVDFIPSWTLTPLNKNLDIALGGGNVQTPFNKKGYQLYNSGSGSNYIRLYCVDCGVNGVINVRATVTFNLIGVISSGSFSANGWLNAGLGLGVDANYATSIPAFSKTIVAIPLSPFAIPGLITIGPHLDFGVGASAGINAKGNLYAGLRLAWPAIHAQLNLYSPPSASGWVPSVIPEFQAAGQVTMSASVYATVSIGFGVSILNGLKSFGVALVEKPELYVGGTTTNPTCGGLRVSAGFRNSVYADVFGSHYNINVWDGPSTGKCVAIRKRDGLLKLPALVSKRADAKQIKTSDGSIGLHYADNGNVYALPQGNGSLVDMSTVFFSTTGEGIVTGDVESRIFHGYKDSLDKSGVSRFRLSRPDHIPTTAVAMTLQNSDSPEYPNILVALDSLHNVYYPIVCAFGDKDFPRMFLAKNPEAGAAILMNDNVVDEVTGVKPEVCEFLPMVSV